MKHIWMIADGTQLGTSGKNRLFLSMITLAFGAAGVVFAALVIGIAIAAGGAAGASAPGSGALTAPELAALAGGYAACAAWFAGVLYLFKRSF